MKALIVSLELFQSGKIPNEVKEFIEKTKEPFIILDESSKIKTNTPCATIKKSKKTQGVLKLNNIGERCIATGTFMTVSPLNAYDQMNFLCPNFFPETMFAFSEKYEIRKNLHIPGRITTRVVIDEKDYLKIRKILLQYSQSKASFIGCCEAIKNKYGISPDSCRYILQHETPSRTKNLEELWSRIGGTCLKVDRKDVEKNIPPLVYKTYYIELTKQQQSLYKQLQKKHCTEHIIIENPLELYTKLLDICNGYDPYKDEDTNGTNLVPLSENPKIDLLQNLIESLGEEQVVIWCSRTKLLYDCVERMKSKGYTTCIYDGKVDKKERKKDYEEFSKGNIQLFFANPKSAGFGLNGLQNTKYAIFISNSSSVEERVQAEKRIYRGVIKESKYIIDIICKGTCEEKIVTAHKQGKDLLHSNAVNSNIFNLDRSIYGD